MRHPFLAAACALVLLAPGPVARAGQSPARTDGRILVVPFENLRREASVGWLTEGSAILVTRALGSAGHDVITRDERLRAFERLQLPPVASLSEATVIRVGELVGASRLVLGGFAVEAGELRVSARSIELDTGRMSSEMVERGPLDGLLAAYDRLGRRLVEPLAAGAAAVPAPPETLPVFESYVRGLLGESVAAQVRSLEAALKLEPRYDPARLALWQVFSAQGDHGRAAQVALAVRPGTPLYRRARFLASVSRTRSGQYDEAFQILKALVDEAPAPALFNNMGVVQLRRGATPQTGRPTYYFNQAAERDRGDADCAFNLGYAYWWERDPQAAVYWLKEAVRRNPADGDAHYVLAVALQAAGAQVEGEREKELARALSSKYPEWERRPAGEAVPRGLERLRDELDTAHLSLVDTTLAPGERRDQQALAVFHLERGRRYFDEQNDRAAAVELNRSLYNSPYQSEALMLLGRIHLRAGRLREAEEALKISLWSQETAAAHVTLGEVYRQAKELVLAGAEADKALALDPANPDAMLLKARIK
jgi:tetratricopeptide (TPR) repeat protein